MWTVFLAQPYSSGGMAEECDALIRVKKSLAFLGYLWILIVKGEAMFMVELSIQSHVVVACWA